MRTVLPSARVPKSDPSHQLSPVRITAADSEVIVDFEVIEKPSPAPEELTFTERLLTLGRTPDPEVPDRAVVSGESAVSPANADE